jgi:amino acid transporter
MFSLAENGHMPRALAKVSKRGTPDAALLVLFVLAGVLATTGSFKTLALVSVVARFAQYITTCMATIVLRHRRRKEQGASADRGSGFTLPWGSAIPTAALVLCGWLLTESGRSDPEPIIAGGIALLAGTPVYLAILLQRKK